MIIEIWCPSVLMEQNKSHLHIFYLNFNLTLSLAFVQELGSSKEVCPRSVQTIRNKSIHVHVCDTNVFTSILQIYRFPNSYDMTQYLHCRSFKMTIVVIYRIKILQIFVNKLNDSWAVFWNEMISQKTKWGCTNCSNYTQFLKNNWIK